MAVVDLAQIPGLTRSERREAAARGSVSPVVTPVVVADETAQLDRATGATRAERRRALEAAPAVSTAAAPLSRREARIAAQQSQRRRSGIWLLLRAWWFYALLVLIAGCAFAGWSSANTPAPPTGIVVTDGSQES